MNESPVTVSFRTSPTIASNLMAIYEFYVYGEGWEDAHISYSGIERIAEALGELRDALLEGLVQSDNSPDRGGWSEGEPIIHKKTGALINAWDFDDDDWKTLRDFVGIEDIPTESEVKAGQRNARVFARWKATFEESNVIE